MSSEPHDRRELANRDGGGLQQQGSIDWARLTGSAVSFAVEFLVRLSNGGIETLTVIAAETVLAKMKLGPIGEKRAFEAVGQLKAFSSFNKFLQFGFGAKHAIRQLAESSEGLNCIVMCSALLEFYSAFDAAKILRQLLVSLNPPGRLTPSLKQWIALIEACGGAFATSDFGALLHTISGPILPDGSSELRTPSDPQAVADALNKLIAVSNHSLNFVQFVGGADCGFIAAFSAWLLNLPVHVKTAAGHSIFTSCEQSSDCKVQVVYTDDSRSLQLVKQRTILPSGSVFMRYNLDPNGVNRGDILSYGRVPWKSLLRDTFGRSVRDLLDGGLTMSFGRALGCGARIFTALLTRDLSVPDKFYTQYRETWEYLNSSSHGRGFINTVRQRLPELAGSERLMDAMERSLDANYLDAASMYEQSMHLITAACRCKNCLDDSSATMGAAQPSEFCQVSLIGFIAELVQIISCIILPTSILPSRSGLESLYWRRYPYRRADFISALMDFDDWPILDSEIILLTGRKGRKSGQRTYAVASDGLCFFRNMLVELSTGADRCKAVHVVPGRIEWESNLYAEIRDLRTKGPTDRQEEYSSMIGNIMPSASSSALRDSASLALQCELLVEEYAEPGEVNTDFLAVAYSFTRDDGRKFFQGPSFLSDRVGRCVSAQDCKGKLCGPIPHFDIICVSGEGKLITSKELPGTEEVPFVVALQKSVLAQLVALVHDGVGSPDSSNDVAQLVTFLQERECLRCLLLSTIKTPAPSRTNERVQVRRLCIITS